MLAELHRLDQTRRTFAFDLPGHGESAAWESYDVQGVADGVHEAVEEAGLDRPVIIGHSMGAIIAGVYASRFPTRAVVNVDQPLQIAAFAELLHSIADQLRGPAFPAMWEQFAASMHPELLPESARELVQSASNPRQDLVLGYWREILERPVDEMTAAASEVLAALRDDEVPYLIVVGSDVDDEYREWLDEMLPQAEIVLFPDTGHFPHLADPGRFVECLAATAQ